MANISAIKLPDGITYNIADKVSGYITGMTILSYGSSTWTDFLEAYNLKKVVYCRASSNSNPGTGSQTRLAFMAYVNNAETPTEVEFQYYRSVSSHSDSQQGDQVYVYKLNSSGTWSVITRNSFTKIAVDGDLTKSYSNGTLTLSVTLPDTSGFITTETDPIFSASVASGITSNDITNWNNKSDFSGSYDDLTDKPTIPTIPTNISAFTNDAGYLTTHQDISGKQDTLVSGTNIKTINNESILGSGNITISASGCLPLTGGTLSGNLDVNAEVSADSISVGGASVTNNLQVNTINGVTVGSDPKFTDTNTTYNFSGTTFYSGNSETAEHNANNAVKNGNYYYTSNGPATSLGATSTDGALYVQSYSDVWVGQIAQDYRNGHLYVRGKNGSSWQAWKTVPTATFSTTDLTAGSSTLATGQIYLVYE